MKFFSVTLHKTGEYGDMYDVTDTMILMANAIVDIIPYLRKTYMEDAILDIHKRVYTLWREVDGYPSHFLHEIIVHEVAVTELTDKIKFLG